MRALDVRWESWSSGSRSWRGLGAGVVAATRVARLALMTTLGDAGTLSRAKPSLRLAWRLFSLNVLTTRLVRVKSSPGSSTPIQRRETMHPTESSPAEALAAMTPEKLEEMARPAP